MTDPALIERITRSLAFMLRHQPETFDLELDPQGYADLDDVVQALNERLGEPVEEEDVRDAVHAGDRPRYEIVGDRIRALYGHSIPVDPGPSAKPPEFLYVAIPEQDLERARRFGLRGGRRRFLHLASTREDAAESGRRASREYAVLMIHALDAWEEGISFYDRTALWLAEEIPTHLIEVEGTYDDGTEPVQRHFDGPRDSGGRERERGGGRGHERGGDRHGRGGRGRGGRGRGRDRERQGGGGPRDERGGAGREGGRGAPREPERVASFAPPGEGRGRWSDSERPPRGDERPPQGERAAFAPPRADERSGRGDGRRDEGRRDEGRRDERPPRGPERGRPDRDRPDRGRHERPERAPERPEGRRESFADSGRDSRRSEEREGGRGGYPEPRRETRDGGPRGREAESAPRPAMANPPGGFGAGLEAAEEARRRQERAPAPPPPPRPAPPPRREERRPPDDDRPSFGAGL